jgi:periplasmic divalent cation tolerance protein
MTEFIQAITTIDDLQRGQEIASALLKRKLAGCCQILGPITSMYQWQGDLVTATEYQIWIKTRSNLWDKLQAAIHELHPYDVPELLVVDIPLGAPSYLDWLKSETA